MSMKRFAVFSHVSGALLPKLYFHKRRDAATVARLLVYGAYDRSTATAELEEWIEGKGYVAQEEFYWDQKRVWSRAPKEKP